MNKFYKISLLLSLIAVSANASLFEIEGLKSLKKECANGTQGFSIEISREGIEQTVTYDSCAGGEGIIVTGASAGEGGGSGGEGGGSGPLGETVEIDGFDYYFPNGYTPTSAIASDTCGTGYNNTGQFIGTCTEEDLPDGITEGWLNLVDSSESRIGLAYANLENVDNLANLTYIGGDLNLSSNPLSNIDGLKNLQVIDGQLSLTSNPLTNLDGLSNLETLDTLLLSNMEGLENINGLSKLTEITGSIQIDNNPSLTNLNGLSNITTIGGDFHMEDMPSLTNLDGLSNLTSVDEIQVTFSGLQNVNGLSNLTSIPGSLFLPRNSSLTDISGLSNITSIGDTLNLSDTPISNVNGLSSLKTVPGQIYLNSNSNLTDLSGLNSLESVGSIYLEDKEYDVKLSGESYLCQNFSKVQNYETTLTYSNVCD